MIPRLSVTRLEDRAVPAAYTLDPTFGGDGRVDSAAGPVAVQADGKVVAATTSFVYAPDGAFLGRNVVVRRLNADGTPDPTFGTGGEYVVGGGITPVEVRVDAQDRVTVLSTDGAGLVVSRPGGYGEVRLPVTNSSPPRFADMEVLADGSVLVAARSSGGLGNEARTVIEVRRVTPAGAVDPAGTRTFEPDLGSLAGGADSPSVTADRTRDLLLRPDGAIFLARASAGDSPGGVVKLRPDGTRDTSFDGDGIQAIAADANLPRQDALSVFPAPGGSVLVYGVSTGEAQSASFPPLRTGVLTRLTTAGAFDAAFGTNGSALLGSGTALRTFDAAHFRADGSVILVGNLATPSLIRIYGGKNAVQIAAASADGRRFDVLTGVYDDGGSGGEPGATGTAATASALDALERVVLSGDLGPSVGFGSGIARLVVPASPFDAGTGTFLVGGPGNTAVRVGLAGGDLASGPLASLPGSSAAGVPQVSTRVASADLTGDGVPDFVAGTGPGYGSTVAVVRGNADGSAGAVLTKFAPFEAAFDGGVFVAVGDVTGDGVPDVVVTPDVGGGPVVVVYDGAKLAAGLTGEAAQVTRYFGIDDPAFRGGARAALGEMTGDGVPDVIVAAGFGGGPRVTVWDGAGVRAGAPRQLANFFAFEPTVRNGAFVSAGDVDGDGVAELAFGGGPGGGPRVRVVDGASLVVARNVQSLDDLPATGRLYDNFVADSALRGGVRVLLRDVDGDGRADVVTGSGAGEAGRVGVLPAGLILGEPTAAVVIEESLYGPGLPDGVYVG